MGHAFNPTQHLGGRGDQIFVSSKASLVYMMNSRTAREIHNEGPSLEKKRKEKEKERREGEISKMLKYNSLVKKSLSVLKVTNCSKLFKVI